MIDGPDIQKIPIGQATSIFVKATQSCETDTKRPKYVHNNMAASVSAELNELDRGYVDDLHAQVNAKLPRKVNSRRAFAYHNLKSFDVIRNPYESLPLDLQVFAMENIIAEQLMKAATMVEERLDQEIHDIQSLDEDGLEALRRKRLEEMKQKQTQKMEMMANGHGKYEEVPDERAFFDATKKSDRVVCHFYQESEMRCKVVHKHLQKLAAKYLSTRFISVNADKAKFLITRLNIRIIPTICIIVNQKTSDYIRVFEELGKSDDFKTEVLEARLGRTGVIDYEGVNAVTGMRGGDLRKGAIKGAKKIIRGPAKYDNNDSDASDDW
ncbi:hypothetical protein QR680_012860 [Steinernema hermaphroditum]|uniref:Phosducin domain-containing protein n=1 Tax=Steinernema hermaphroditum TaxID=289476 RepID=A0AA39I639_9BILA|nr:hypothetical protein QR680_012860 [Steinernema hermaphroditum]